MWLIPLIALGVLIVAAGSRRDDPPTPYALPAAAPSPISVLREYMIAGQLPPRPVILCAIAEAQATGRLELAGNIARAFSPPLPAAATSPPPRAVPPPPSSRASDQQIQAALDVDPRSFVHAAQRGEAIDAVAVEKSAQKTTVVGVEPAEPPVPVDPTRWSMFCDRLAREPVLFQSSRHVGQYRQRRERLAELGIDPKEIVGSAPAQRAALDRDLADACHHAREAGDLDRHVGRLIRVPGFEDPHTVTLSGVLGVIQCAGLENAVDWFEAPEDRKRFPHTTQAFVRTNGCF